jgi:hypothetical protein
MENNQPTLQFNFTCMMCGNECDVYEELVVHEYTDEYEMWCYCKECDIDTFHPPYRIDK